MLYPTELRALLYEIMSLWYRAPHVRCQILHYVPVYVPFSQTPGRLV